MLLAFPPRARPAGSKDEGRAALLKAHPHVGRLGDRLALQQQEQWLCLSQSKAEPGQNVTIFKADQ